MVVLIVSSKVKLTEISLCTMARDSNIGRCSTRVYSCAEDTSRKATGRFLLQCNTVQYLYSSRYCITTVAVHAVMLQKQKFHHYQYIVPAVLWIRIQTRSVWIQIWILFFNPTPFAYNLSCFYPFLCGSGSTKLLNTDL